MDWNGDGKHDYQDHSFYNNVIAPTEQKESQGSSSKKGNYTSNNDIQTTVPTGFVWFIIIGVIYLFIKLIGG